MESTFKLIVTGIQPNRDPGAVRERFRELIKGNSAEIEKTFQRIRTNDPVVLAEDLPQEKSGNLLKKLNEIGLACRLDPMRLTLVPIDTLEENAPPYQCPACGNKQPPTPDGSDICERCGVVGRNYQGVNEYKMALEAERQRLRAMMNQENAEKAKKAKEWVEKQQEKLQQERLDQARRQAEKELNITPWYKIKQLLKPHILIPILGGTTLAAIGVGLLVWQLATPDSQNVAANATGEPPAGLQIQITPPSNIEFKVGEGGPKLTQAADDGTDSALPGALPPEGADNVASPGKASTPGSGSKTGTRPIHLIDFDKVALVPSVSPKIAKPSATVATTSNPQLFVDLARYQVEVGELTIASQSLEHASELLEEVKRGNPTTTLLDAINRDRAEILAAIAYQHHQRKEFSPAQTQWYEAMNLANAIVALGERAQAFASIARTLQETTPATAGSYFGRAIDSARTLNDPAVRSITLSSIARDLTSLGQYQQAEDLFAQAATGIPAITDAKKRLNVQCAIAKYRAEAGDNALAQELLKQIAGLSKETGVFLECDRHQADAQSAIARNLAKNGDISSAQKEFTAALDRVVKFQDPEARASAMLYLARNLVDAGDLESAARIVAVALQDSGVGPASAPKSRA